MTRRLILVTVLCLGPPAFAQGGADSVSLQLRQELASRADSLARLDPAVEVAVALRHHDRRFIGIQGYVRVAPGISFQDPMYPKQHAMRVIQGTSDGLWAPEVARLGRVGALYAEKYNRLLLRELRRRAIAHRHAGRDQPGE